MGPAVAVTTPQFSISSRLPERLISYGWPSGGIMLGIMEIGAGTGSRGCTGLGVTGVGAVAGSGVGPVSKLPHTAGSGVELVFGSG